MFSTTCPRESRFISKCSIICGHVQPSLSRGLLVLRSAGLYGQETSCLGGVKSQLGCPACTTYGYQPASIPHIVHVLPTILAHFEPILRLSNSLHLKATATFCQKAGASRSPKHPVGTTLPKKRPALAITGPLAIAGHLTISSQNRIINYSGPVSASGSTSKNVGINSTSYPRYPAHYTALPSCNHPK